MRFATVVGVLACFTAAAFADEKAVTSKIESVGLFKNGLAVIERTVELPGEGTYRIDDVPTPVHGTFFIESQGKVGVRVTTELVDAPLDVVSQPLQDQLAGKTVTIALRDQKEAIEGTVSALEPADKKWGRDYNAPQYGYANYGGYGGQQGPQRFLILDTKTGRTLVDQGMIASMQIAGDANTAKQRKPVLLITAGEGTPRQNLRISYLTTGLAWAPSYRVDLLDDKKLSISQNAVVKNELMDLKDVEVRLISGYPSIEFATVTSPLSLQQNWSAFFQQLSNPRQNAGGLVAQQQAVTMNYIRGNGDAVAGNLPGMAADESIDIHYEPIGKQTLDEGDAMAIDVAGGEADYSRLVEWVVPDPRLPNGRYQDQYQRQQNPDAFDDSPWDAVKFKNPLAFAMTTAPATFSNKGQFIGQQLSRWVNAGEETTLRITKALSVRTRATEQEKADVDRNKIVFIGGNDYRQTEVTGELSIRNFRKTDLNLVIKRQFSGELIAADEKPDVTLREEGVWSANRRNELKWNLTLKAGEEKVLKYSYKVLVDN